MTTTLLRRPVELGAGDGGGAGWCVMVRWAWRLFRREWRQQLLVLALIAVAVAATILGAAIATSTRQPSDAGFGTANHLVTIPGSDPHLVADIAAIKQRFGAVDVIENQTISTGTVTTAELRAQVPNGPYGKPLLALVSGHYPSGPDEIVLTKALASTFDVRVGDNWHEAGSSRRIVGLVENPQNLADEFALVAPGQVSTPNEVTVLFDATSSSIVKAQAAGFKLPSGANLEGLPPPSSNIINPETIVLVLATFGLVFIGLVAVAGFTVMAQRRVRALGMLGAIGATDRNIRLVMVANGAAVGIVAAFIGVVLGFSAWFAYVPHLQTIAEHRIDLVALPWWLIVTAIALAVTTAILAARWPARSFARIPVLAALSGRPAPAQAKETTALRGGILLAVGFAFVGFAGSSNQHGGGAPQVAIGLVAMIAGSIFLAPLAITELARFGRRMPIAVRLSLRDLDRYRARSGAALSAISIAVMIAVIICVAATGRFSNVLDYAGPNLPANQLIAYVGCTSSGCPTSPPTGSKAEAMRSEIAASLGTHDVLALDSAVDPKTANIPTSEGGNPTATLSQTNTRDNNYTGPLYVATPALLDFFGIRQSQVAPTTDILTARPGLAGLSNMQLLYGNAFSGPGPGPGSCPPGSCFNDPKIETVSNLPLGTSDPNTVITEHAVHAVGLQLIPTGWLFQTAKPLTPIQINDVRQIASGAGAMIETKSSLVGLSALTDWATAAGILLALGVLAMTVGLIRSETAPDLRILTATGASGGVRSALTGITAGALGLLGGLLGTAVAYLACVAFFRTKLGELGHPPALDLLLVILGMPLAAAIGGWLVAGREPPFIARQPIE